MCRPGWMRENRPRKRQGNRPSRRQENRSSRRQEKSPPERQENRPSGRQKNASIRGDDSARRGRREIAPDGRRSSAKRESASSVRSRPLASVKSENEPEWRRNANWRPNRTAPLSKKSKRLSGRTNIELPERKKSRTSAKEQMQLSQIKTNRPKRLRERSGSKPMPTYLTQQTQSTELRGNHPGNASGRTS